MRDECGGTSASAACLFPGAAAHALTSAFRRPLLAGTFELIAAASMQVLGRGVGHGVCFLLGRLARLRHLSQIAWERWLRRTVTIIQGMTGQQFYKSMTSHADARIWQDIYHVPYGKLVLYLKFTTDAKGYLVISLKEK